MSHKPTFLLQRVADGEVDRVWIETSSEESARRFCATANLGFSSIAGIPENGHPAPLRECYTVPEACGMLCISRSTLYRELADGKLKRLPGTGGCRITRASIEARKDWKPQTARRKKRG